MPSRLTFFYDLLRDSSDALNKKHTDSPSMPFAFLKAFALNEGSVKGLPETFRKREGGEPVVNPQPDW